jgi:UPF0271 protein
MIHDVEASIAQVRRMVGEGKVKSVQGAHVEVIADTLCIHGDEPSAVEFARRIRRALADSGIRVAPIGR